MVELRGSPAARGGTSRTPMRGRTSSRRELRGSPAARAAGGGLTGRGGAGIREGNSVRGRGWEPDEGAPSLGEQFGQVVYGAPAGLWGFVKDVGVSAAAPVRMGVDIAQGDYKWNATFGQAAKRYTPALHTMGTGIGNTAWSLTEGAASLAPGGMSPSETEYGQAVREGRIVGKVVEDIGNVAIAAGGASAGLGRAASAATRGAGIAARAGAPGVASRLTGAAGTAARLRGPASRLASVADRVEMGAAMPYFVVPGAARRALGGTRAGQAVTGAARQAGRGAMTNLDAAAPATAQRLRDAAGAVSTARAGLADRRDRFVEDQARTREGGGIIRRNIIGANEKIRGNVIDPSLRFQTMLSDPAGRRGRGTRRNPDAETAAILLGDQRYTAAVRALDAQGVLDPDARYDLAAAMAPPDQPISRAAWAMVEGRVHNTLDPAVAVKLDTAGDYYRANVHDPIEASYLSGFGASKPLTDEALANRAGNVGDVPNPVVVENAVTEAEAAVAEHAPRLFEAYEKAERARGRAPLTAEQFTTRARGQIVDSMRQARMVAARVVKDDPARAKRAAGVNPKATVRPAELTRRLASALVAGGSRTRNPALVELRQALADEGLLTVDLGLGNLERALRPVRRVAEATGAADVTAAYAGTVAGRADAEAARAAAMPEPEGGAAPEAPANFTRRFERAMRVSRIRERRAGRAQGHAGDALAKVGDDAYQAARGAHQLSTAEFTPGVPVTAESFDASVRAARTEARKALVEMADTLELRLADALDLEPFTIPGPGSSVDALELWTEIKARKLHNVQLNRVGQTGVAPVKYRLFTKTGGVPFEDMGDFLAGHGFGRTGGIDPIDDFLNAVEGVRDAKREAKARTFEGLPATLAADPIAERLITGDLADAAAGLADEVNELLDIGVLDDAARAGIVDAHQVLLDEEAAIRADEADFSAPDQWWSDLADELYDAESKAVVDLAVGGRWRDVFDSWVNAPAQAGDPAVARRGAVTQAERTALLAWLSDQPAVRVGERSRPARRGLSKAEKALYDLHVANAAADAGRRSVRTERAAMGRRLVERGHATGVRQGIAAGRVAGKVEGRAQGVAGEAGRAARRAEQAAQREAGTGDLYEASVRALADLASRAVESGRRAGLAEEKARVAERAYAREARTHAKLVEKFNTARVRAEASPEAIPTTYAPAARAAGEMRQGALRLAADLEALAVANRDASLFVVARAYHDIAASAPTSLAELQGVGVWHPQFRYGAHETTGGGLNLAGGATTRLPRLGLTRGERQTVRTGGFNETTVKGLADAARKEIRQQYANEAVRELTAALGRTAAQMEGMESLTGPALAEAMRDAGYTSWNPSSPFESVKDAHVNENTVFLPEKVWKTYKSTWGPKGTIETFIETWYDKRFIGPIKAAWLAYNPRWMIGNVVGNAIMGSMEVGFDYFRALPEAIRTVREGNVEWQFRGAGHVGSEALDADFSGRLGNRLTRRLAAGRDRSYALNEFMDNVSHSAVYIAAKRNGASPEVAVNQALRAIGDYQRMTPTEQRVIKRAVPFYPWIRHITKLTVQLPFRHPMRVAWWLWLGEVYAPEPEERPGGLRNMIPAGDGTTFWQIPNVNPFTPTEEMPAFNLKEAGRSLTPAISWPLLVATGFDLAKFDAISTSPGTNPRDEWGREGSKPLWTDLKGLAWWLSGQFPQSRTARNIIAQPMARDQTGRPILTTTGPLPSNRYSRLDEAVGYFGVPYRRTYDAAEIAEGIATKKRQDAAKRDQYQRRLARISP